MGLPFVVSCSENLEYFLKYFFQEGINLLCFLNLWITGNMFLWLSCRNNILAVGAFLTHHPQNAVEAIPIFPKIYCWERSLIPKRFLSVSMSPVIRKSRMTARLFFILGIKRKSQTRWGESVLHFLEFSGFWIKVKDFLN